MRREELYVGRRFGNGSSREEKERRPKRRWLDRVRGDIREKGLSVEEVYDRATWRHIVKHRPGVKVGIRCRGRRKHLKSH